MPLGRLSLPDIHDSSMNAGFFIMQNSVFVASLAVKPKKLSWVNLLNPQRGSLHRADCSSNVQDNAEAWSILQGMVKELTATEAHLSNGDVLPYGMAVWSTGVGPTSFTTGLPFAKTARGRIAVDGGMRVLQHIDPEKAQGTEVHKPSDVSKQGVLCGGIQG